VPSEQPDSLIKDDWIITLVTITDLLLGYTTEGSYLLGTRLLRTLAP
jgi:hypothetical protein